MLGVALPSKRVDANKLQNIESFVYAIYQRDPMAVEPPAVVKGFDSSSSLSVFLSLKIKEYQHYREVVAIRLRDNGILAILTV